VLSLPVGSPVEAILRPVATRKGDLNAEGVHLLAEWRNRHVQALMKFRFSEDRMMLVARCTDIHLVSLDATLSRIQKHAARWLT
jgi:hypothetical protein